MIDPAPEPPLRPRASLATEDAREIGSIEAALGAAMAAAGLPLRQDGDVWRLAATPTTAALAEIARWLHAQGHGGRWRGEQLSVADDTGHVVGTIERAVVRPLGISTHAVHLVGRGAGGRVWIQQRALDKATDPSLWDTLMGGLMAAGETVASTLERETWEEAGLRVADLLAMRATSRFTIRRPVRDGYLVEHFYVFEAVVPDGITPNNQDGEVAAFALVTLDELRQRLRAGEFTVEAALILGELLQRS